MSIYSEEKRRDHPLWDVYDLLRTASLNVKYHSAIVRRLQAVNTSMEVTLALVAPSSAIAGLWLWKTNAGTYAWKVLAVLAAVVALLKPLLKLADRIRRGEESVTGYRSLYHDLETIGILARERDAYDEELRARFHEALQKKKQLLTQEPVLAIDKVLRAACQREVIEELPTRGFYLPRRTDNAKRKEAG
jgi:hypothetical protein